MQAALAHWPPQERHQFATLLHRMVDDFLAYAAGEEPRAASALTASTRQSSHAPAGRVNGRLSRAAEPAPNWPICARSGADARGAESRKYSAIGSLTFWNATRAA
jgi:hypothetical protein